MREIFNLQYISDLFRVQFLKFSHSVLVCINTHAVCVSVELTVAHTAISDGLVLNSVFVHYGL